MRRHDTLPGLTGLAQVSAQHLSREEEIAADDFRTELMNCSRNPKTRSTVGNVKASTLR